MSGSTFISCQHFSQPLKSSLSDAEPYAAETQAPDDVKSASATRQCTKEIPNERNHNSDRSSGQQRTEGWKSLASRAIKTMANNAFKNSSLLLNLVKPLNSMPVFTPYVAGLTCFNYLVGCGAYALDQPQAPPTKHSCPEPTFDCNNNGTECIPPTWKCDRESDCLNDADENNCDYPCEPGYFKCTIDQCISDRWRCDGDYDCGDGSDEENCKVEHRCGTLGFHCKTTPHDCIPFNWVCDNDPDCPGGEDEQSCPEPERKEAHDCASYEYHCITSGTCIHKSWICDGESDCPDGEDEQHCGIDLAPFSNPIALPSPPSTEASTTPTTTIPPTIPETPPPPLWTTLAGQTSHILSGKTDIRK